MFIKKIFLFLLLLVILIVVGTVYYFIPEKIKLFSQDAIGFTPTPLLTDDSTPTPTFTIEKPPLKTLIGQTLSMEGDVYWLSRIATEEAKLTSKINLQQGEKLRTDKNSKISFSFPPEASVNLSENTEVEIIQTLPEHLVFLQTKGSAGYLKTGNPPLSIRVKRLLIENDGEILVILDPDRPLIHINQNSGSSVIAYNDPDYVTKKVVLGKNQSFTFNLNTLKGVRK